MTKKIIIIGAGPTGLGAAYRLNEMGYDNYKIIERNDYIGGLAASFQRDGYTMDIGGHVVFSHYPYFDKVVEDALDNAYLEHQREAWIWIYNKFVPYPFQNNIKFLPKEVTLECLNGLLETKAGSDAKNFGDWINNVFGEGIANHFMKPYNFKVWAHPLELMSKDWIAERVSVVDFKSVLEKVILDQEDSNWGPNNTFRFPTHGGTGQIFRRIADGLMDRIQLNKTVEFVDFDKKEIRYNTGETELYDVIINTSPLDKFVNNSNMKGQFQNNVEKLKFSSLFSVAVVINRPLDEDKKTKCWNYFPEKDVPFYRVTYLSNYSPNIVHDASKEFMLMSEISFSEFKHHDTESIVQETIDGLVNSGFINESDRDLVVFTDIVTEEYSYPIPTNERDSVLDEVIPILDSKDVYSRGRFGIWRYETGNMDHSFMQGVEVVNHIFEGKEEETRFKN